ncbi:SDR family NAD(P)-dependent oxidoreductase [Sphingobacteriales bacterium UPWRP_1]|nr:hypothetical protein BVG80_07555 [Sphingobacteriales bacterium TSM_CSM]PSJ72294.1 SDR family NAD(P)-dependent oxidoreductase [Sphingobacteriales bacterium UPWRP_1]
MNIIVTGASAGIGFELVRQLCQNPQNRVIGIARNENRLLQLQQICQHNNMIALPFDLATSGVNSILPHLNSHFSKIDVLVNNAGFLQSKPFTHLSDADWEHAFSVNLFSVVRLLRTLFPLFTKPGAHVVNIGSMGGFQGSPKFAGLSAYSASKAALAALTECLAEEWKQEGISINCLALGAIQTNMFSTAFPQQQAPVLPHTIAAFIAQFAQTGHYLFNGKVIPVAMSTP